MNELTMDANWDVALPAELDDGERYRLLADERRQTVLQVITELQESTTELTLGELGSTVDRLERSQPGSDDTNEELLVDLHHIHLPMMDDVGIVEYRPESKRIELPDDAAGAVTPDERPSSSN